VQGEVWLVDQSGNKVRATSGSAINHNARIQTGADGRIQVRLRDESVFTVGANSEIVVDSFVYDPASGTGKLAAQVVRGAFRFVTGLVERGAPGSLRGQIRTSDVGAGIRGSDVVFRVLDNKVTVVSVVKGGGYLEDKKLALIEVRGDLLPAALNLWGLVVFVSNRRKLGLTAALFTLAFLAKMTTVFGAVAVALSLLFTGQRKAALRFVGWMALGYTAGLLVVHIASGGRALQAITAVASGGASWVQILLRAPLLMLKIVLPSDLILAVLALGTAAGLPGQERRDVLPLAVLTTGFITLVMYGSPGVDRNHLIDFDFIAMVFLVASGARGRIPLSQAMTGLSLAVLIVVPTILRQPPPQRTTIEKVIAETRSGSGPLLVENPWWAILAGERPFILDAFNLRIMADRDPKVARALYTRLDTRFFRAVILEMPIDQPEFIWGDRWYGDVHFGKEFPEHLTANYDLVTTYPGARGSSYFIWRPKASSTSKHGE